MGAISSNDKHTLDKDCEFHWIRAIFGGSLILYYSYFKKFKTADDMNNHMIEKHKIEALRFNCENCSKVGSE